MRKIIFVSVVLLSAGLMLPAILSAQTSMPPISNTGSTGSAATTAGKCGVNTFSVNNECGANVFKTMYVQCYDGFEEKQGGDSSCKSSEQWQEYAKQACSNHCSGAAVKQIYAEPSKTAPAGYEKPAVTSAGTISVCQINNDLTAQYDALISELQIAQKTGDANREKTTTDKILELKQRLSGSKTTCSVSTPTSPTNASALEPVKINRCAEVENWGQKISYYEKLKNLSDSDLQKEAAKSRQEINDIVAELIAGLEKVKTQCKTQTSGGGSSATAAKIGEPVKPVAIQSAQEISDYYKAKIESIVSSNESSAQVEKLNELKQDKDKMVVELMKNRNEIESAELNVLAKEIKISKNEMTIDGVAVETTGKKILMNVGTSPISVESSQNGATIKDQNLEIKTNNISIKNNVLTVNGNAIGISASQAATNLNITPVSVELAEQNSKPVYKIKISEARKFLGFIPSNILKTQVADAENGNLLSESRPWYYFLTTK
jgi:hypothetical protein